MIIITIILHYYSYSRDEETKIKKSQIMLLKPQNHKPADQTQIHIMCLKNVFY